MDISKLTHGTKVVLGGSVAFLIVSIFNWQEVDFQGIASVGVSMWHGWGVLAGLLAISVVVWEGLRLANVKIEVGLTPTMVTTALAILLLFFTALKFLVSNEFRTFWAWLGLLLAVSIAAGAYLNMQALGESIAEMGTSMKAAASSAAAAAKAATDKGSGEGVPVPAGPGAPPMAPAAPEAPAPPAVPEAPAAPAAAVEGQAGAVAETPPAEGGEPPHAPA